MGVSIDVWRQRIGTFIMPSAKSAGDSIQLEAVFPARSWHPGIGIWTFVIIMAAVAIGCSTVLLVPPRFCKLQTCADVELNPGPTPLISDEVLELLKVMDFSFKPLQHDFMNKHMVQLIQLKGKNGSCADLVKWMNAFLPAPLVSSEGVDWPKKINTQAKAILTKKTLLQKTTSEAGKMALQEWENTKYVLPTTTGPRPRKAAQPSFFDINEVKKENETLNDENEKLKLENDDLKQKQKCLLERPSPHKESVAKRRESYSKKQVTNLRKERNKLRKKLDSKLDSAGGKRKKMQSKIKQLSKDLTKSEVTASNLCEQAEATEDELLLRISNLEERIRELEDFNADLLSQLEESKSGLVHLMEVKQSTGKKTYTAETRKCVYKLLEYHVSFGLVGPVIKAVLSMLGKTADQLPSDRCVSTMGKERLLFSQHQLTELTQKENLTLATDETPKCGDYYMAYTLSDDTGDSYVLGMRDIVSKSAEDTLTTLKMILDDISAIHNGHKQENEKEDVGMALLCQIKNTMSDRAATEAKFNDMLKTYREECLPLFKKGWESFTEDAKLKLAEMNNFFCGLHLLVSMAETISTSFKNFEDIHLEGEIVGAPTLAGLRTQTGTESGTVRLVRTMCKAFAKGGDEKAGCHRHWKTYLRKLGRTKLLLQNFRGNRFNIVFLLGGCVYHLRTIAQDFLKKVFGTPNLLLKAVQADLQVPVYQAGCRVLGLLNKLITAPLWRITESEGHILDMCNTYTQLDKFLQECIADRNKLVQFAHGDLSCFSEEIVTKDQVFLSVTRHDEHDQIVYSLLQHTFIALQQLITRVTKEYLPAGKYNDLQNDESFRKDTISAPKHNKLPERIFGYLDFLLEKRPNVAAITNEAQIMFVFNKTAKYIENMPKEEFESKLQQIITTARNEMVIKAKQRENDKNKTLLKKQEEKQQKLETQRKNELKRRENLATTVIDATLWQNRETVVEKMEQCTCESERHEALKKQIQFRRKMLLQYLPGDNKFFFTYKDPNTSKYKPRPHSELQEHLYKFIDAALSVEEGQTVQKINTGGAVIKEAIPLLVGKTVIHTMVDENDKRVPYLARVISQVPGFPTWFNITYKDDNYQIVYSYELVKDYKDGDLEIVVDGDLETVS